MRAFTFNLDGNWTRYLPFLLAKLGVYQGWVNADAIMDQDKFVSSQYDYKPLGCVTDILQDLSKRSAPVAPALVVDRTKLDGTSTPSTQSTDKDGMVWKIPDLGNKFAQLFKQESFQKLRDYPFSPLNAPNMGEANNLTPLMYMEPDPNHQTEYVAAVYILEECFHNNCVQRAEKVRNTRFESKNDPAWHYKDGEQFELLKIVNNDAIQSPVHSLDDLNLKNHANEKLVQSWLDKALQYLNGTIGIGRLSSKNTAARQQQKQRLITTQDDFENKDVHRTVVWNLAQLNKTMLHKIKVANHFQKFGVAVFWVSTGTGSASADMRKTVGLQAPIPPALFEDIDRYKVLQEFFKLHKTRPRYVDYLDDNANIFHITFKPQQGESSSLFMNIIMILFLGKSHYLRPGVNMKQPDSSCTTTEKDQFEFRSEINDICSNVVDLTIFRKDKEVPVMDYLVAMESNIQITSSLCHIGNSIPHYFDRPRFSVDGKKYKYYGSHPKAGTAMSVQYGQTKRGFPLRPDCRMGAAKIIMVSFYIINYAS